MVFHGKRADVEQFSDFRVGFSLGQPGQYIQLVRAEIETEVVRQAHDRFIRGIGYFQHGDFAEGDIDCAITESMRKAWYSLAGLLADSLFRAAG